MFFINFAISSLIDPKLKRNIIPQNKLSHKITLIPIIQAADNETSCTKYNGTANKNPIAAGIANERNTFKESNCKTFVLK